MNTKNKNHLSKETILGWIRGNLPDYESKLIADHLESCDSCFIKFSTLHASYQEIENVELEVTPDMLIERANKEFNLGESRIKVFPKKVRVFTDQIGFGLKKILQPHPVVYALVTVVLVIVILYTVKEPDSEPFFTEETQETPINLREKFPQTQLTPVASTEMSGISVNILLLEKKLQLRGPSPYNMYSLVVTQPFRFNRNLTVQTLDGEILLSTDFQNMTNNFDFSLPVKHDSIRVRITTLDSIVYEDLLDVEQGLSRSE
ncbi:MAG: hypothetical protein H8D45_04790 [Bacteroidetes bacterium]|nr:hypothetical protein [Bacteroidota bacterium]